MMLGATFADDLVVLLGRDATFSGRTLLWDQLIELISQRPLLGYGYGAIWRTSTPYLATLSMAAGWTPEHAHNAYLDLLLALGLTGTAVLALSLLRAIGRLWATLSAGDATAVYFSVTVLTFSLAYGLVESQVLADGKLLAVLFVATLSALLRPSAGSANAASFGPSAEFALTPIYPVRVPSALACDEAGSATSSGGGTPAIRTATSHSRR